MFNLTPQERLVVFFLAGALAVGAVVRVLTGRRVPPPPPPIKMEYELPIRDNSPAEKPPRPADIRVDVNRAGTAELCTVPGVGPKMAAKIIEERTARGPFRDADDLTRVKGINKKTAEKMKRYVVFGPNEK